MTEPSHSSRFNHPNNIGWGIQIIQLLIVYFSSRPCYLVPPGPKYSPQHPILKHPQPTFLPQYERPSFTPIQNNWQNYISLYLLFLLNIQEETLKPISYIQKAIFASTGRSLIYFIAMIPNLTENTNLVCFPWAMISQRTQHNATSVCSSFSQRRWLCIPHVTHATLCFRNSKKFIFFPEVVSQKKIFYYSIVTLTWSLHL